MKSKDLLSVSDLSGADIESLILKAVDIKAGGGTSSLAGKIIVLLFEKPSLRTRVSFEVGVRQLGGDSIYLSSSEVGLGKREAVPDVARVLSRYADAIVARTFSHQTVEVLARCASKPVINALSDLEHPCQALTDLLTIFEKKGRLKGITVAYVGDGNNVAHSLLLATSLAGVNMRIATPAGYEVNQSVLRLAEGYAAKTDAEICCTTEPGLAVAGADVVYTDVWASMGQESEAEQRRPLFAAYQVNAGLLSLARADAILMHPLPAHYGEEVAENILESPQSVVFDQAENRLHLQKALLAAMLGGMSAG